MPVRSGGRILPEITYETTREIITNVEKKLRSLQSAGLPLELVEKSLLRAKRALKANKMNYAISAINEVGIKLEEVKRHSKEFSTNASEVKKNVEQAKLMDVDTTSAKELYRSAHELFREEKFNLATDAMKKCKQQINDSLFLFITEEIKQIYTQFKQLPKNITQSHEIRHMFNDVDGAINKNDFEHAWKITTQLKKFLSNVSEPILEKLREQAKDKIIQFQNEIENAQRVGVDLTDAHEIFSELVGRMKNAKEISGFKEVIEYTAAGRHALERSVRRKQRNEGKAKEVNSELDRIILYMEDLKDHCAIPGSVEELISNAKTELSRGNFDSAMENIKAIHSKLKKFRNVSVPKVELSLEQGSLQPNFWNRARIHITNRGLASAANINVELSGPIEVRRMPVLKTLGYNKTETFEIGLKVEGAGSVPVDMDIKFDRSWDGKSFCDHQELWLDVIGTNQPFRDAKTRSTPDPFALEKKSESEINCIFCNNIISRSVPIFKCSCGTIYHLECITNLDACLNCNRPIDRHVGVVTPSQNPNQDADDVDWE